MRLFWIVTAVHLIVMIFLGIQRREVSKPAAKIEIYTVQLQPKVRAAPPSQQTVAQIVQEEPVQESQKVRVQEKPKSKTTKPLAQKPAAKKSSTQTKPTLPGQKQSSELKRLLQDSLTSLDKRTSAVQISGPTKVGKLQSEGITFTTYETLLVEYLKELLELPEPGEVRLRLTLNRDGRVRSHTILQATKSNRDYIDREITALHLPPFESHFKGEKEHTFPITLKTY